MVHHGMTRVMPFYHSIPKRGHTVRCIVGDRIEFGDLVDLHERNTHNRLAFDYPAEEDLLVDMTNRIHSTLTQLDRQLVQIEKDESNESNQ